MKTIMCFGDSNTFGEKPAYEGERQPWGVRWTSILQEELGFENYHVYENGYNGRTTVFTDPYDPLRNGLKGMRYALATHRQLDLIIICLGTNDAKMHFNTNAKGIVEGYDLLIQEVKMHALQENLPLPKFLLLSPVKIGKNIEQGLFGNFNQQSIATVDALEIELHEYAKAHHYSYFSAAQVATVGKDQLHMDSQSHTKLALSLLPLVQALLT